MRKLILNIFYQLIAFILLFSAAAFWFGYINDRSLVAYGASLLVFAVLISDFWSLVYLLAFSLSTAIVLPIVSKLNIVPGARTLIAATIYGALFLIATLIISNKWVNKHNRKDDNKSGNQG